jgi:hypothetical protein
MKNIERKYAYHDDGVLPAVGEDGVTYLTLYSSNAGNTYDGWIWDPDRVHYSETERTFGYRYPGDENYCWDDEVTVDLSNAQNRQESSENDTGRITSFNTNVSTSPIILQDVDITGLTEEERESKSTTILFTAIPLVKSAYIQAEIEVSMKMNISPTNTNGNVRVEAFYILNDESDRTMRPNPINHYSITKANEYHTMRLLYFNPAVNHEQNNYIGVKLLVSGGTAEIGISDNPDYGDAIITLVSSGLVGDRIDDSRPDSLTISTDKPYVPYGYKFDLKDYNVRCTYNTGAVYDVKYLSSYNMNEGDRFLDRTTIEANYRSLSAYCLIQLVELDHIELTGIDRFYDNSYTLDISNYTVTAYTVNGDTFDMTDFCTFSPIMGSTITETTTLTATYTSVSAYGIHAQTLTDSLTIEKMVEIMHASNDSGLIYTLYNDRCIRITGNANIPGTNNIRAHHEYIKLPTEIKQYLDENEMTGVLVWAAEGEISGMILPGTYVSTITGFNNVIVKPFYSDGRNSGGNGILLDFKNNSYVTSYMLEFFSNVRYDFARDEAHTLAYTINSNGQWTNDMSRLFANCVGLRDINFLKNLNFSISAASGMFSGCTLLSDVSGAKLWKFDASNHVAVNGMFSNCESLISAADLSIWDLTRVSNAVAMFSHSGLENLVGIGNWTIGTECDENEVSVFDMFSYTAIDDLIGLKDDFFTPKMKSLNYIFEHCENLTSLRNSTYPGHFLDVSNVETMTRMFADCINLEDISDIADWDVRKVHDMKYMFDHDDKLAQSSQIKYLTRWSPGSLSYGCSFQYMFRTDGPKIANGDASLYWDVIIPTQSASSLFTMTKWSYTPFYNTIKKIGLTEEDRIRLGLPELEENEVYAYSEGGMFSGYDIVKIISHGPYDENEVEFVKNGSFLPNFYRETMEYQIAHYD